MKATPAQIAKLEELIDGYKKNDSPIEAHIGAIGELTDYFIEKLCEGKLDEYSDIAHYIALLGYIKRDFKELIKD